MNYNHAYDAVRALSRLAAIGATIKQGGRAYFILLVINSICGFTLFLDFGKGIESGQ